MTSANRIPIDLSTMEKDFIVVIDGDDTVTTASASVAVTTEGIEVLGGGDPIAGSVRDAGGRFGGTRRRPTVRISIGPSGNVDVNVGPERIATEEEEERSDASSEIPSPSRSGTVPPMEKVATSAVGSSVRHHGRTLKISKGRTLEISPPSLVPAGYGRLPKGFPFSAMRTSVSQWRAAFSNVASGATALEGSIGAGKTTFGKGAVKLMRLLGFPSEFLEEPLIEDYLKLFLEDQKKHAYGFQREKCFARSKVYRKAEKLLDRKMARAVLIDRSRQGDWAFALMHRECGNMTEKEYETYLNILNKDANLLRRPDRCIYFKVAPKTAMRRIAVRDRCGEDSYTEKYLLDLRSAYDKVLDPELCGFPICEVPYDEDDPIVTALADLPSEWGPEILEGDFDEKRKIKDWLVTLPTEFSSFSEFLSRACEKVLGIFAHPPRAKRGC
jgi:deoxyadenosine/deoxycytidine kinase